LEFIIALMLVHCFWLFEFKFKFEFICLCSFQNSQTPFLLPLSLPLFWPNFMRSPQGRSLSVPLHFFVLARPRRNPLSLFFVAAQRSSLAQPARCVAADPSPRTRARSG
jgi:hypothetical protein